MRGSPLGCRIRERCGRALWTRAPARRSCWALAGRNSPRCGQRTGLDHVLPASRRRLQRRPGSRRSQSPRVCPRGGAARSTSDDATVCVRSLVHQGDRFLVCARALSNASPYTPKKKGLSRLQPNFEPALWGVWSCANILAIVARQANAFAFSQSRSRRRRGGGPRRNQKAARQKSVLGSVPAQPRAAPDPRAPPLRRAPCGATDRRCRRCCP